MMSTSQFSSLLVKGLQKASETHTGSAWNLQTLSSPLYLQSEASSSPKSVVEFLIAGTLDGKLYLGLNDAALRSAFQSSFDDAEADTSSAYLEFCRKAAPVLAEALSSDNAEIRIRDCRLTSLPEQSAALDRLQLAAEGEPAIVSINCDATLRSALASTEDQGADLKVAGTLGHAANAPLDRVIDVPLAVTLRFGQRQLTLREVLELNTGSLLELDHQVEEPVHLMLGERVIARGEVVIVDGAYGMRVTEVVENQPSRLALR